MKFKYEYPSYINLQRGDILGFHMDDALVNAFGAEDSIAEIAFGAFRAFKSIAEDKRYYVTDSLADAVDKVGDKLRDLINADKLSVGGLFSEGKLFMHRNGFAMHAIVQHDGKPYFVFYIFSKDALVGFGRIDYENPSPSVAGLDPFSKGFLATREPVDPRTIFFQFWASYMMLIVFLAECEVETIVVKPETKLKYDKKKYFNDLKSPITFLDCRWFRELIIDAPFGVSGHLRWQPFGEGRSKKKLIWIAPFEKKGYHRKPKAEHLQ